MSYQHQELTRQIIGAAIEVHKILGPGLLESAYRQCLVFELEHRGLRCNQELLIPILYKHKKIDYGFRLDLIVENTVILELKSVDAILSLHKAQLLTYLRLANKQLGLLINFNVPLLKDGIHRIVLNAEDFGFKEHLVSLLKDQKIINAERE